MNKKDITRNGVTQTVKKPLATPFMTEQQLRRLTDSQPVLNLKGVLKQVRKSLK